MNPTPKPMSDTEFREGLEKLGMSAKDFARTVGLADDRGLRRIVAGQEPPGPLLAFAMRSLMRLHIPTRTVGSVDRAQLRDVLDRCLTAIESEAIDAGWPPNEIAQAMRDLIEA